MKRTLGVILLVLGLLTGWSIVSADEFFVIPVKKCCTCKGTLIGTRWCDNGDGTVTDLTSCLVWLKYADWGGQEPWRNSSANCDYPGFGCYYDAHRRAGILADGEPLDQQSLFVIFLNDESTVGDWRLPTKAELVGITIGEEAVSTADPQAFRYVQPDWYWSSTTHAQFPVSAWKVRFSDKSVTWESKDSTNYVWPVRSGQD